MIRMSLCKGLGIMLLELFVLALAIPTHAATGVDWTLRSPAGTVARYRAVTYGQGRFVAVANNSSASVPSVMTSDNGFGWTAQTAPVASWQGVAYGNNTFVAVGLGNGGGAVMTSPDGITWTERTSNPFSGLSWESVAYGNGLFVVVGSSSGGVARLMISPDGITWRERTAAISGTLRAVIYAAPASLFVAVSGSGGTMRSSDGVTWTANPAVGGASPFLAPNWYGVSYGRPNGNGLFVAVSSGGEVATSADGENWNISVTLSPTFRGVAYGSGRFVAVGDSGATRFSSDGVNWSSGTGLDATKIWRSITFGSGLFVSVSVSTGGGAASSDSVCGDGVAYTKPQWQQFALPCTPVSAVDGPQTIAGVLGNYPTANLSSSFYASR